MEIKNPIRIEVDTQSIHPTLICNVSIEFERDIEIPLSLSGRLFVGNKVIATVNENKHNTEEIHNLKLLNREQKQQRYKERNRGIYNFFLETQLSSLALNHIEETRDKHPQKAIEFYFELVGKSLELPSDFHDLSSDDALRLSVTHRITARKIIEQSDWCNNYSNKLGIGKFMLVELQEPSFNANGAWEETMFLLNTNIGEMRIAIQNGDWHKTIWVSRRFLEKIDLTKSVKNRNSLKEVLSDRLSKFSHNEKGVENLYNAIRNLFDFTSKWAHENDFDGSLKPIPLSTKEDAYLVYSLSIALLGILSRSLND